MGKRKSLHRRLQDPVRAPDPNYRGQLDIAIRQRDSALAALNRRANIEKLMTDHDEALLRLEQSLGIFKQLNADIGERCRRLTRALGNEDAEGGS
jgi:hypothetical protein